MPKKKITKKPPVKKSAVPNKKNTTKKAPIVESKTKLISTKQGLVEVKVKQDSQTKKDTRKYVKVYENDPPEKRKEIGEKVFKKEIKFAYYASEGSQGVWYYVIL